MNTKSNICNPIKINPSIKTAIIYSLDDLFAYTVEIKEGSKSYYVSVNDNEPAKFGNMEDARQAALNENVKEAYLALSKTYEENDLSTSSLDHKNRYDYSPIVLHDKK